MNKISRSNLDGDDGAVVGVFPMKEVGLEFLEENNAWGFVRLGREFEYVAMYVSGKIREVKYFATVQDTVPAEEAKLVRPIGEYVEIGRVSGDKKLIRFKEGSLYEFENPIPFETKYPLSHRYTTFEALKTADTTDDLL